MELLSLFSFCHPSTSLLVLSRAIGGKESIPENHPAVNTKHNRDVLYCFQKERKMGAMALPSERPLASTDWKILRELQQDAHLSSNELGRRVGLSTPGLG
jgi:hypothetical protein